MSRQDLKMLDQINRRRMVRRSAGVSLAIFPLSTRCKIAGETPGLRKACIPWLPRCLTFHRPDALKEMRAKKVFVGQL
jgi:hypothetical protein